MTERVIFKGIPISGGVGEGPVKHLPDFGSPTEWKVETDGKQKTAYMDYSSQALDQIAEVLQNDVIVTPHLWMALYWRIADLVSAIVVTEMGLLSHAAALAREGNIIIVATNNQDFSDSLPNTNRVKVDGNSGIIYAVDW